MIKQEIRNCLQRESSTIMAGSKSNFESDLSDLASSLHLYGVLLSMNM